jgi:ubiquinone/menaquinone biosynthesis C-methylase UbiE
MSVNKTQKLSQRKIYDEYAREHAKYQNLGLLFNDLKDTLFEIASYYARDSFLRAKKGDIVLDVGCGEGRSICSMSEGGAEVVGCDLSKQALTVTKLRLHSKEIRGSHLLICDAEALPFRSDMFNKINIQEVLEHVPNDISAVGEIYRVLKKDGLCYVSAPSNSVSWTLEGISRKFYGYSLNDFREGHIRNYSADELRRLLEVKGFQIVKVKLYYFIVGPFFIDLAVKLSGILKHLVGVCSKDAAKGKHNFGITNSYSNLLDHFETSFRMAIEIDEILFNKGDNGRHIGISLQKC